MESCETCRFFFEKDKECRLHPPRVLVLQNDRRISVFPETSRAAWCGQHARPEQAHRFQLGSSVVMDKENNHG